MAYKDPMDPRAKAARRKHYQLNREQYFKRNQEREQKIRLHILTVKHEGSCADCGASYPEEPWLMDFDHVRGEKKFDLSNAYKRSWRMLLEELEKCDLVCVLCHRRRTAQRAGWKNLLAHNERDSVG